MSKHSLNAISPVDGRYAKSTSELNAYFSEFALIKYRVQVEVEYFIALCNIPLHGLTDFKPSLFDKIRKIYLNFSSEDALYIKSIEKITNHDIKAVEYFLKEKFDELKIDKYKEFIHFALTSQDINNTAMPLMLKDAHNSVIMPSYIELTSQIKKLARKWKDVPMLAHTHGQPASPTTMGKEFLVFVERMEQQLEYFQSIPFSAKFGGAVGNFNAHHVSYPYINWIEFANNFVNKNLGLNRSRITTQIEHYDNLAAYFDTCRRINTILVDFSRDVWQYISMNYFKIAIKEGEVGSSAMPHKVNPIDFENAEGNLGMANAIFEHLSSKLPISRLQRDLTDSTVSRNTGVPLAHTLIALKSIKRGLDKLAINEIQIKEDLNKNWVVVAEAIQTVLRSIGYPNPYEKLKELTRTGNEIKPETLHDFIDTLQIDKKIKNKLKTLTPFNYIGIVSQFFK